VGCPFTAVGSSPSMSWSSPGIVFCVLSLCRQL
jgi:hypothetical protein